MIGHALLYLVRDPAQLRKLRADPSQARGVFEEAVRHLTPLQTLFRTTTVDGSLGDVPVRTDRKIMVSLAAANHHPRRWTEPDRFDLEREASGHVGFGRGVHVCVGMHVARLEAECLLTAFARRVESFELIEPPS